MSSSKNIKKETPAKESILVPVTYAENDSGDYLDKSENPITSIFQYIILGVICLFSFLIRLFAIFRFESVFLLPSHS